MSWSQWKVAGGRRCREGEELRRGGEAITEGRIGRSLSKPRWDGLFNPSISISLPPCLFVCVCMFVFSVCVCLVSHRFTGTTLMVGQPWRPLVCFLIVAPPPPFMFDQRYFLTVCPPPVQFLPQECGDCGTSARVQPPRLFFKVSYCQLDGGRRMGSQPKVEV